MTSLRVEHMEWTTVHLKDVVDPDAPICYGIVLPGEHYEGGVPVVKVKDIIRGSVRTLGLLKTSPDIDAKCRRSRLVGGDILLSIRGTVGRIALVPDEIAGANITQDTARLRISCKDTRDYVFQVLQSDLLQRQIRDKVVGQAVQGINIHDVRGLRFPFPRQLHAQHFIAQALACWNAAIENTQQLIAAKGQQSRHLREHCLQNPPRSQRIKLHAMTRESIIRNGARMGRDAIMAVTKQVGMRPMRDETIAANIERYKVVSPRAFAYNPMRLNIGSIAMSPFDADVLVSPDYVVFECDHSRLLPEYLNHLRFTRHWVSYFGTAGNGSVRVRIYYDDLGAFAFDLPPLDVQKRVVELLDAAALEIEKLAQYAQALTTQKRGLMQKLLTGQWQVKLPEPEIA